MNYHLFQLICRFKLVLRLITLQMLLNERGDKKEEEEERETDRWQQSETVYVWIMMQSQQNCESTWAL